MFGLKETDTVTAPCCSEALPTEQVQATPWLKRIYTKVVSCWTAIAQPFPPSESATSSLASLSGSPSSGSPLSEEHGNQRAGETRRVTEIDAAMAEERSVMTALRTVGLYLTKTGFEPGKDFSIAQGKLILNSFAFDYLKQKLDPTQFAAIAQLDPGLLIHDHQAAMQALERHLGTPFFANLRETMLVRLPTLSDAAMLGYASRLIQGITQRHPGIKGFEHWVKQVVHEAIEPEALQAMERRKIEGNLQIQDDDGWVLLIDLLLAAGGQEGVHFQRTVTGVMTTVEGKKLLGQLIAGAQLRMTDLL